MPLSALPALNAGLNATSAILLLLGFILIKQRALTAHTIAMLGAALVSAAFLVSYLYYHAHHGTTRFPGAGFTRTAYFVILTTHTFLAVVMVPMILLTLYRALRGQFPRHMAIARVTFPIWLYVSATCVVIYFMLYRLYR